MNANALETRANLASAGASLDDRYLEFSERCQPVFAAYPELESLRHYLFRELWVRGRRETWKQWAKHWLRPVWRGSRTRGPLERADVMFWFEDRGRTRGTDMMLPVSTELASRGGRVSLVGPPRPPGGPVPAVAFRFSARARPPTWGRHAWDALCQTGEELRRPALTRAFYHACAMVQALLEEMSRVLEAIQPRVAVLLSTQLAGGAGLVTVARTRGTCTLLLQHGILQPFYLPVLADRMLTWGPASNDTLLGLGVPAEKLVALGSPGHDRMAPSRDGRARAAFLESLGLPDRPTLVFFSNGNDLLRNGNAPLECARWLGSVAAAFAHAVNVVVRLHPNEDGGIYHRWPALRITKGAPDLATTLEGCDCVASLCSTVLHEALLYDKPVWQFHADGWPTLAACWEQGLAVRVSSSTDLMTMLGGLGRGTAGVGTGRLADFVFVNRGRATQAVADYIEALIAEA